MSLKEEIKETALNMGADLVGVASVERFIGAPPGFHPTDIMPQAKSVVSIAKKIPGQLVYSSLGTAYTIDYKELGIKAGFQPGIAEISNAVFYIKFNRM